MQPSHILADIFIKAESVLLEGDPLIGAGAVQCPSVAGARQKVSDLASITTNAVGHNQK